MRATFFVVFAVSMVACRPAIEPFSVSHIDRSISDTSQYPVAVDVAAVGTYPGSSKSGAGVFYDDVLEYRVWLQPESGAEPLAGRDFYFAAFAQFEQAESFARSTAGATVPLVLVRQLEWINEPKPGEFEHKREERITEWRVEWLENKRGVDSISDFLANPPVQLSMAGWIEGARQDGMRVWRDTDDDVLSLTVVDSPFEFATEAKLQRWARELAQERGGGLIEVALGAPRPRSIASLIYKRPQGLGYVYTGMLFMAGKDRSLVWTVVAVERGMTGVREAIITAEMLEAGELTIDDYERSWAQDPYDPTYRGVDRSVLRFMSDDKRYDVRFPQHPLSKVRRVLATLPSNVSGAP